MPTRWGLLLLIAGTGGCALGPPSRPPGPENEVVLRADDRENLWVGHRLVAPSGSYGGLAAFVACSPGAHAHAAKAERYGAAGGGLTVAGGSIVLATGVSTLAFTFYEQGQRPAGNGVWTDVDKAFVISTAAGLAVGLALLIPGLVYGRRALAEARETTWSYNEGLEGCGVAGQPKPPPTAP
jgi:hypothetical protein